MDRRIINPWRWQDDYGFVQGNEITGARRLLLCAGQTSVDDEGRPVHPGDMAAQFGQALDNLETVLRQAGFTLADVIQLKYYTTDVAAFSRAATAHGSRLAAAGCRPASTVLGVCALFHPDILVEIEATAAK